MAGRWGLRGRTEEGAPRGGRGRLGRKVGRDAAGVGQVFGELDLTPGAFLFPPRKDVVNKLGSGC